jgi:cytochrome c biogenesis protein CcmG, thiol:disulfide interchange protein DsbE
MRRARPALGLVALLALSACGADARRIGPVRVGDPAPVYAASTLEGRPESIATYAGRPLLLNVWATWCAPCREEIPALEALHREYGPRGLAVVGVSIDRGGLEAGIRDFLGQLGASYTVWLDPAGDVQSTFGTVGVPSTFLIDPGGTVVWKHLGPVREDDAELRGLIERSL